MTDKELVIDMTELVGAIADGITNKSRITMLGGGNSMYPYIDGENDLIELGEADAGQLRPGMICLYRRISGKYAIHRIYSLDGDTVSMLGDSQLFIEKGVKKSDIIAAVTKVIKPYGEVDCTDPDEIRTQVKHMKRRIRRHRWARVLSNTVFLPVRAVKKMVRIIDSKRRKTK